jgi:hypothetical protein
VEECKPLQYGPVTLLVGGGAVYTAYNYLPRMR